MDYAGKVWIAICGGFILLVGVLSANGGLTWTDKALQLKQAQTRVIDMNAIPEEGSSGLCWKNLDRYLRWIYIACRGS